MPLMYPRPYTSQQSLEKLPVLPFSIFLSHLKYITSCVRLIPDSFHTESEMTLMETSIFDLKKSLEIVSLRLESLLRLLVPEQHVDGTGSNEAGRR